MKVAFLVFNLDGMGGTSRSAITQANALAAHHDVGFVSVTRSADSPHYGIDPRIVVDYLVDVRDEEAPAVDGVEPTLAVTLHQRESALVPARWDKQFTALCNVALEAALPRLDVDVVVTVTPGLLAAAIELLPDSVVVVHQEHRSSSQRTSGLEPLLTYAPRADVVALLTPSIEAWLRDRLGEPAPHTVVMPNPLPLGFTPRSRLDNPLIVTAGRLVPEKQFPHLVQAFAMVADQLPEWRLRICGEGGQRSDVVRQIRRGGLWDRVELPGSVTDMAAEWAKASVAALTSRTEGFPLVLQEAMAAGVPVASYDCASGPREIVQHEVNGLLVAADSIIGMATALLRLASDAELRRRLGEGALASSGQYDAAALAERWAGVFADARARRGGRGRRQALTHAPPSPARPDPTATVDVAAVTPAGARHDALRCVVDAARSTGHDWFVIPAHEHLSPRVVVPMPARDAFLAALATVDAPAYLSLRDPAQHGWHERRGPLPDLATDLRRGMTALIVVEPWPEVAQGCGVEVEFWDLSPEGDLVALRPNPYADRLPLEPETVNVEVHGVLVRTLPRMLSVP